MGSRAFEYGLWAAGIAACAIALALFDSPAWCYLVVAAPAPMLVFNDTRPVGTLKHSRRDLVRSFPPRLLAGFTIMPLGLGHAIVNDDDPFGSFMVISLAVLAAIVLVAQHMDLPDPP